MISRVLRPALFVALLFACNSGSSSDDNGGSTSPTSPGGNQPGRNGEAGNNDGASSSGGATSSGGNGSSSGGGSTSSGGSNQQPEFEPGPPHIQYIGRFDTTDTAGPRCAYAGCRIVARFDGAPKISAKLQEQYYDWMEGAPSEWDVSIDGKITQKLVMSSAETDFVIADNLAAGPHVIELYKRSEPQTGTTQFKGFTFTGGTMLSPPSRKQRRIEIVGDSSSTGYGIEGVGLTNPADGTCPGVNHAAKYQNFRKAYGPVLGELVNAEVYGSSLSGKGIYQNIWSEDKETLPMLFVRTLPMEEQGVWDFKTWQPDVVVVMAGGNDFAIGKPVDLGPASPANFTQAYRDFTAKLRSEYPQAHLVLTVSPTTDDNEPAGSNTRTNIKNGAQTVATERNAAGDAKVYFFEPVKAVKSEMTGCFGHGSPAYHERVAKELETFIKPKLGW